MEAQTEAAPLRLNESNGVSDPGKTWRCRDA